MPNPFKRLLGGESALAELIEEAAEDPGALTTPERVLYAGPTPLEAYDVPDLCPVYLSRTGIHMPERDIRYADMQWYGLYETEKPVAPDTLFGTSREQWSRADTRIVMVRQLVIHLRTPEGWRMHLFEPYEPKSTFMTDARGAPTGLLRFITLKADDDKPAPVRAGKWRQDSHGRWELKSREYLFLAPEHLVIGEFKADDFVLSIDDVVALALNALPGSSDKLLRIDYSSDHRRLSVGLTLPDVHEWAEVLARHTGIPLEK